MNILQRAQASWDSRPTHEIAVPEWAEAGKHLIIYFKAPNLATLSKVVREAKGDPMDEAARLIVACSLDVEGKRLFNNADIVTVMNHVDPAVVGRIAAAIKDQTVVNTGETEKNSEAIPSA